MNIHLNTGMPFLRHSLIIAATALTCAALRADQTQQHSTTAATFIQKAAASGWMEVQVGKLAQSQGQSQEVKDLGATLVRDHSQANQKLQQLAQTKNIQVDQRYWSDQPLTGANVQAGANVVKDQAGIASDKHAKHQHAIDNLRGKSGAEFDKEFVTMAIKDHKKDISEFEKARTDLNDPEIRAFIDETVPKLRNHLQLAQTAARAVGVDEAKIAADVKDDADQAVGAPAGATRGSDKTSSPASNPENAQGTRDSGANKDRSDIGGSSIDNNSSQYRPNPSSSSMDTSGTVQQNNNPSVNANVAGQQVNAQADLNQGYASVTTQPAPQSTVINPSVESAAENHSKFFQKGDNKVLGLSTDKHDGKFWGFIPNPRAKKSTTP